MWSDPTPAFEIALYKDQVDTLRRKNECCGNLVADVSILDEFLLQLIQHLASVKDISVHRFMTLCMVICFGPQLSCSQWHVMVFAGPSCHQKQRIKLHCLMACLPIGRRGGFLEPNRTDSLRSCY